MASLDKLPPELLLLIAEDLDSAGDVLALIRACRRIHPLLSPLLLSLALSHPANLKTGDTVLHFSAKSNNLRLASYLLSHRVPVSPPNNAKWTPLHLAALHDHVDLARILLEHGAAVNISFETFGSTPLHRVYSSQMAELLIAFGADVTAKNFLNQTPLHTACSLGLTEVVQVLIEHGGGDVVYYDRDRITQLDLAVKSGEAGVVKLVLESSCGPQLLGRGGEDILRRAAKMGFADVVKVLLDAGLDVEEMPYRRKRANSRWRRVRGGMLLFLRRS